MTANPDRCPPADLVLTFTPKGERALDALAAAIVNGMSHTPQGLARALDTVFHTPVEELVEAFTQIADHLEARQADATAPPRTVVGSRR
jgi:hypothetical protein